MKQMYVSKTTTNIRRLTREGEGVWEVRSSRYPQLWYRVVLGMDTNQISCGCKGWKFQSGKGLCRHMMAVIEREVKV
ncbi:MAG: SWIM zinc finger family protein [Nitrososphaeraceae archaeon]